ncbi:MAG: ftsI [Gammaproteobacteria bacterium]|nr:ftsI [Gammaproteobacteria bacterium]
MSFYTRHTWRWVILLICLSLAFVGLLARFVQLTVIDRSFLLKQGDARSQRIIERPALRGMITDRDKYPLAITTRVSSIWVDPQKFVVSDNNLKALSTLLGDSRAVLQARLKANNSKEFVYLKRHISPQLAQKVMALNLPGVHSLHEYRRYYPEADVTAQLIGFTNIDNRGQEGMELAYNQSLEGTPGKEKVSKDGVGHVVALLGIVRTEEPGKELVLSIDHRIQYLAYRYLADAVTQVDAVAGSVIVLDVKTGEVLAMANVPSYNPNQTVNPRSDSLRNRCVTDVFEPGSTTKAFSLANVLAQGKYTPDSLVDTNPGWMVLNGHVVRDPEGNDGVINMTTVLVKSSNVGTAKLTLTTPPNSLWELLHKVGYGQLTGSGFPGEVKGSLPLHKWSDFTLATLSFGYGLSTTPLQVANAYATIARGGIKMPVSLVKLDHPPQGERVMDAKIAGQIKLMLEAVVDQAAVKAQVPGYRVLGKTGTVRMLASSGKGYDEKRHIAFFAGAAPASDPRLVVMVVLQEPKKGYYSAQILAPVFSQIMGGALRVLDIAPDKVDNKDKYL